MVEASKFIDYYEILEISPNANSGTIDRMFRYLAQRYHPDNQETGDRLRFDAIVEAHDTLKDPVKRAQYDIAHKNQTGVRWKIAEEASDNKTIGRDVEIQNKILEFVTPLYEQAKVEEQRATPSVIVLDTALVPERKAKPKAALFGLVALVVSTLLSFGFVFGAEGLSKMRALDPERVNSLWATAWSDWFGLRWNRKTKL